MSKIDQCANELEAILDQYVEMLRAELERVNMPCSCTYPPCKCGYKRAHLKKVRNTFLSWCGLEYQMHQSKKALKKLRTEDAEFKQVEAELLAHNERMYEKQGRALESGFRGYYEENYPGYVWAPSYDE